MPSKSKKQDRFMRACAHDAGYESCPPKKVAKEFVRGGMTVSGSPRKRSGKRGR